MKKREFNRIINSCCRTVKKVKRLDVAKIAALPVETQRALGLFVVRAQRGPLLIELARHLDRAWLASCGYFHKTEHNGYTFLHTAEYPPNRGY
jgi:hypothetical protein